MPILPNNDLDYIDEESEDITSEDMTDGSSVTENNATYNDPFDYNGPADIGVPDALPVDPVVPESSEDRYYVTYYNRGDLTDYEPAYLQGLAEAGCKFYAIYDDETEVEIQWTEIEDLSPLETEIDISASIAAATNQHFWDDTNGVHVAEVAKEDWQTALEANFSDLSASKNYYNILMNSLGLLLRRANFILTSINRASISFYDGLGNETTNIMASFGRNSAQIGRSNDKHVVIDNSGLTAYNSDGTLAPLTGTFDGANINNSSITNAKIVDGTIEGTKIASATIDNSNIKNGTIEGTKIASATIDNSNIKNGTITGAKIADGTIENTDIKNGTITGAKIASATIENSNIKDGTIQGTKIVGSTLTGIPYAGISDADIEVARVANAEIAKAEVNYAHITNGVIDNAKIDHADVNGLSANYATVTNLNAATARIGSLEAADVTINGRIDATEADIDDLEAEDARIGNLVAQKASITDLNAATARIGDLEADHVSVEDFEAEQANIDNLQAATADIATIRANSAKVQNLTAAQLEADHATVGSLSTTYATITNLNAATGRISDLESTRVRTTDLEANYITADTIEANYTKTDLSNTDVAWIQNGTIKDGAISNAMIGSLSASKLTAGTINGNTITVTNLNADNITAGTLNGQRIGEGSLSLSKLEEDVYTESEVDSIVSNLQTQIDGAIETWTGMAVPTLNNSPASGWTTNAVKDTHVGDVYFVVNSNSQQNGYNYRFTKSGSTYSWQLIKDSDVTNALQRLSTAEGKITTFDSDISQLKTDTGTLTTKTTSLETRMSNAESDILDKVDTTTFNEVSDTVDSHSQSITQMSTTLSNKADSSTVTAVTNRVSKTEQDISGINTTIGTMQTTLASKADGSTVETMSTKLNTVSDTVDGHTQSISSITSTQTTMQGKLDKTLVETTQLWFSKANTTAPNKPTAQVTSTSTEGNAWRVVVPAYNSSYPNYYYCYQWKYSDGTYGWSSVTRDIAMGESQERARTAITNAAAADTKAGNAASAAATAQSTADTANTNASAAVSTANTANTNASTALSTANTAASDASDAKTDAAAAVSTANTASSNASTALSTANTASSNASTAVSTANTAKSTADTAKATADKNVKSTTQLWYTKANETAPAKPTSKVTSTAVSGNGWRVVVPTYASDYPYYFYCYQYELADGTFTWSDVVYDRATTENQSNSRNAVTGVSTLTTKTNNIQDTVDGHTQSLQSVTQTQTTIQQNAVKSTVQLWFTKANTTAPNKPTAHVTTNNAATGNAWNLAVPTYNASYPNYYYCYEYEFVNGSYGWSAVTRDIATGEMQERARTAITNAAAAQSDIDGLEIGGRNLLPSSVISSKNIEGSTKEFQLTPVQLRGNFGSGVGKYIWNDFDEDTQYTFTVTAFQNNPSSGTVGSNGPIFYFRYSDNTTSSMPFTYNGTGEPVQKSMTSTSGKTVILLDASYGNSSCAWTYRNLKLEKGNRATDWTPAPEDVDADISTAQTSADNAQATADKNVKESVQLWFTKANGSAPDKPTTAVTSTATSGNAWTTKVPTYSVSYPHYFYCMQYKLADGTYTWSDVVYDQATTEAQSVARTTSTNLSTLQQDYATFKQTTQNFESTIGTIYATKTEVSAVDDKIDNLEIGGRNLLSDSLMIALGGSDRNARTTTPIPLYTWSYSNDGEVHIYSFTSNTNGNDGYNNFYTFIQSRFTPGISEMQGHEYSWGVDIKVDGVSNLGETFMLGVQIDMRPSQTNKRRVELGASDLIDGVWIHIGTTETIGSSDTSSLFCFAVNNLGSVTGPFTISYRRPILVYGNSVPQDWTPAPEDVDAAIEAVPRMAKINTASRNFTTARWKMYGARGHSENWTTGSSYDNSHLRVGDRAYMVGTISDQNSGTATIIGEVTSVGTASVALKSEQLIFGGDVVSAIESRVSSAETSITQNNEQIALKANASDVYTKTQTDGLISTEVSNRNSAIEQSAAAINLSVSETYATKEDSPRDNILRGTNVLGTFSDIYSDPNATWSNGIWSRQSGASTSGSASVFEVSDPPSPEQKYGFKITCVDSSNNHDFGQKRIHIALIAGIDYTISGWVKIASDSANNTPKMQIRLYPAKTYNKTLSTETQWTYFTYTFSLTQSQIDGGLTFLAGVSGSGSIEYCGLKLEKGSDSTSWCYSSQDSINYVNIAKSDIKITTDGITSTVEKINSAKYLVSGYAAGTSLANIRSYASNQTLNFMVESTEDARVGDTVYLRYKDTTRNCYVYIKGTVSSINSTTSITLNTHGYEDIIPVDTIKSTINQSSDSVKIQARHVEIDGAAIFSNSAFKAAADAAYDAKGSAATAYNEIKSMGEQLIVNGNGFLGDNTNFTALTFDGSVSNNSPGSFTRSTIASVQLFTNYFFLVDPSKTYACEFDVKCAEPGAQMYAMLTFYDADKYNISIQNVSFVTGSTTTLAQPLNNGDTKVYLASAAGFTNTTASHQRSLIFWNYTNSFGYTYPPETYSRNVKSGIWADDSAVDKTNNVITLSAAWTGGHYDAGTYVSQNHSGGTYCYFYSHTNKATFPRDWYHVKAYYSGIGRTGVKFWPGTAYCKIGWLWNYQVSSSSPQGQLWITNVSVKEDTITHAEVQTSINDISSSAAYEEQYIYRSAASGVTSMAQYTTWVTANGDTQNAWTTKRPVYDSSYPVLFVAKQRKTVGGTVTCTTPVKDDTTTVIDGGHITTGTIDADRISTTVVNAINANVSDTINADKINVSSISIGSLNGASDYATKTDAQGYANAKDDAIAAAAKRTDVAVAVTAIDYNLGTATLQATLYIDGTATTSNVTYKWLKDGSVISGQTARTLSVTAAMGLSHVYSCTVTYS